MSITRCSPPKTIYLFPSPLEKVSEGRMRSEGLGEVLFLNLLFELQIYKKLIETACMLYRMAILIA